MTHLRILSSGNPPMHQSPDCRSLLKTTAMKTWIFIAALFFVVHGNAQTSKDEAAIREILRSQTAEWNKGNKESFMQGYWKNDSLLFVGKAGPTYGFDKTLSKYQKSYPDTAAMGKLSFNILQVRFLSAEYCFVLGKWMLKRSIGDLSGHYTLLFRKINGEWKIIVDHSS
jgi:ketosteroid isomerase-like protein